MKSTERIRAFQESFEDREVEATRWYLHNISEMLPYLLNRDGARAGMLAFYKSARIKLSDDFQWHEAEILTDEQIRKTYHYQQFVRFRAYAYWGITTIDSDSNVNFDGDALIHFRERDGLGRLLFPVAQLADEQLCNVLRAGNARSVIDGETPDSDSVSPEELAALARLDIKTMKNLLTPSGRRRSGLRVRLDGMVPADAARRWLLGRRNFLPTIKDDQGASSSPLQVAAFHSSKDIVFVPVAEDGSVFTPDVRREDGYFVVTQGGERAYQDYWKALDTLKLMEVPTWRRPGPEGRWGLVRAVSWSRLSKDELVGKGETQ